MGQILGDQKLYIDYKVSKKQQPVNSLIHNHIVRLHLAERLRDLCSVGSIFNLNIVDSKRDIILLKRIIF